MSIKIDCPLDEPRDDHSLYMVYDDHTQHTCHSCGVPCTQCCCDDPQLGWVDEDIRDDLYYEDFTEFTISHLDDYEKEILIRELLNYFYKRNPAKRQMDMDGDFNLWYMYYHGCS